MMQEIVEEIDAYTNELIIKLTELEGYYEALRQSGGNFKNVSYVVGEIQVLKHLLDIFRKMVLGDREG